MTACLIQVLQGWIDLETGEIDLSFVSEFQNFAAHVPISAAPLEVSVG